MGGWVSREEASVDNPGTEQVETVASWAPALGDGGCRFFGDFRDLAAFGKFR
jgi:hypothetical protein